MSASDPLLVTGIVIVVVILLVAAYVLNRRLAQGNVQVARYAAEVQLDRENTSAWRAAIQALRSDIDGRMQAMEHSLRHVPSSTDFAELEGTVRTIQVQQQSQAEINQQIRSTLVRIEDFLLKGKRP